MPLLDRVLVQRIKPATRTAGGLLLPETAVKRIPQGRVLAVGPGARGADGQVIPMHVNVGATVMLPEYGGHKIQATDASPGASAGADDDDTEVLLFRQDDILAVIKDE